eukprot:2774350-Rhodomonas_salina.3
MVLHVAVFQQDILVLMRDTAVPGRAGTDAAEAEARVASGGRLQVGFATSLRCEIKHKKPQSQYSWYQECVFLFLISGCTRCPVLAYSVCCCIGCCYVPTPVPGTDLELMLLSLHVVGRTGVAYAATNACNVWY